MRYLIVVICAFALAIPGPASAQSFGKNKVNYTTFDWQSIPTEHYDIYYTDGGYEIALIAAEFAEDSYNSLSEHWNYQMKKRVPLLVFNSHNDFSQTNVITEILTEGTGGFTELFKNRVVIPWEGSLAKFRHVIHHELTHAMYFDMLYGGIIESIVGREYMFDLPLWFAEGLAEHESQYWSTEGDMIVRDGIISGYLPDIQNIYSGYLVYKGGESFFKFLQEEYGNENRWIAGELLHSIAATKDVNKSLKSVTGKSLQDLSKEWHRKLRSEHWPEVATREIPDDFAQQLTDHEELQNYLNINPAFNPTGDQIAFLTDRNSYREVMLMSAIDGKILGTVIRGEKAGEYEEMHGLRGGISWSPDGKSLTFAAKAGEKDAIHLVKTAEGGVEKVIIPDMDAVYSPDWSPDGTKILFSGIEGGKLDLFTVDINTLEYTRLTDDFFDEAGARWSPDGTRIAFSSDRMDPPYEYRIGPSSEAYNLFMMDADGSNVTRLTTTPYSDQNPGWDADGTKIVFNSDRNGIDNLYYLNLDDMSITPLTNLLGGASYPDWSPDGQKIAFTTFSEGGWDVYILKRPLRRELGFEDITPTAYRTETMRKIAEGDTTSQGPVILVDNGGGQQLAAAERPSKPYKVKFSPDMFNAMASYNTFYGLGGMGQVSLSDVMGNHRIDIGADLFYSLEESNFAFQYYNLKHQTNFGVAAFHYKTYYRSRNWDIFSDRIYGGSLLAYRPFSMFTRLELNANYLTIERDAYQGSYYYYPYIGKRQKLEGVTAFTFETEFVKDTTLWSSTSPADGVRYRINIEHSPSVAISDLSFTTFEMDYRKYFRFGRKYTIVTRFSGGASVGDTPRLFFLGGTDNWLNARIAYIDGYLEGTRDILLARYPFPLRGYRYYDEFGQRYFLTNFEFRFPFIDYLIFNWPLPLGLSNISGVLFTDIGSAWYKPVVMDEQIVIDKTFHGGGQTDSGSFALDDIKMSWGIGMRMNLGFAVLRLDTAWRTDIDTQDSKPMFSVSLGPDF